MVQLNINGSGNPESRLVAIPRMAGDRPLHTVSTVKPVTLLCQHRALRFGVSKFATPRRPLKIARKTFRPNVSKFLVQNLHFRHY